MKQHQNLLVKTAALVLALAASGATWAQDATPRVDQRQENQQARIAQGAASGALTPREQRRLQREQKGVAKSERRAKADGTVTAKERHRLERKQDRASADIARQKNDAQTVIKP